MNDRSDFDELDLPPDLAALDAELSSIRYEERPSFAPELEAELAREWRTARTRTHWPVRQLLAAGMAGVCLVALGVPSARAALVRLVDGVIREPAQPAQEPTTPAPSVQLLPFDPPASVGAEPVEPAPPALRPPAGSRVKRTFEGPEVTFPEIRDRAATERIIQRNYPVSLQARGVGGTVRLQMWVDSAGTVDVVKVKHPSGVPQLDEAAVQVAPSFQFVPARRRGRGVGTWVEFDVRFQPPRRPATPRMPDGGPVDRPDAPEVSRALLGSGSLRLTAREVSSQREADAALASAIDDPAVIRRLGPVDAIMKGDPPPGAAPTQWRAETSEALEAAIDRAPDNPAPFLALARIRRKQGLRTEARVLYERGLGRAQRAGSAVSPAILADLYYERGLLVRESWLGVRSAGRVPSEALPGEACPQARSSGGSASGYASVDRLIAWNYLCPAALGEAFRSSFEPAAGNADAEKAVMMASFLSAVEADPAHPGANLEILLELADEGEWAKVLQEARRFTAASGGNPQGLLMEGLALQRLSRTEEANDRFRRAFQVLPTEEVMELQDISKLLDPSQSAQYWKASGAARTAWVEGFWARLDPILSTPVNERRVEHIARAAYAQLRFGSALSDPGEVWVRYGRPTVVRAIAEGSGLRTEFWDYGSGPDVTFRRVSAAETMSLTSEGRAYVDELRQVFPHRYGSASRTVATLPGQVARFRGDAPGSSDVEIFSRVPELPASGPADSVELNVFLLGGEGETLDRVQRRLPAWSAPVTLETPAAPEIADVVVEAFNPRTGQAAVLRDSVHAAETASGATISDLLLTRPSVAHGPISRHAAWLRPLTLTEPVDGDHVGVLFELYGMAGMTSGYRLRAEAVDEASGGVTPVRIRPADKEDLRAAWDRRPTVSGSTTEYLDAAIGELPPGAYRLRVVAELLDTGTSLTAERRFERR